MLIFCQNFRNKAVVLKRAKAVRRLLVENGMKISFVFISTVDLALNLNDFF